MKPIRDSLVFTPEQVDKLVLEPEKLGQFSRYTQGIFIFLPDQAVMALKIIQEGRTGVNDGFKDRFRQNRLNAGKYLKEQ